MYDTIEDLKKQNEETVLKIENLMIELEQIMAEKRTLSDQLKSKIKQVDHLQSRVDSIENNIKAEGDRMYDELSSLRRDNVTFQQTVEEYESDIKKLKKLISQKDSEVLELTNKCKELLSNRDGKDDVLKRVEVDYIELTDQVEEIQHLVQSLKRKNDGREAEINRMSQEADDLMKKYSLLKTKAKKQKEKMTKNYKYSTTTIGSRLLIYKLDSLYKRDVSYSFNMIKDFSTFDKHFFVALKKLAIVLTRSSQKNQQDYLFKWYKNC